MKIIFDDYQLHTPQEQKEYHQSGWAYICSDCVKKLHINKRYLDDSGGGDPETHTGPVCSIKGCNQTAEYYIDIPENVPQPEPINWEIPLHILQE